MRSLTSRMTASARLRIRQQYQKTLIVTLVAGQAARDKVGSNVVRLHHDRILDEVIRKFYVLPEALLAF